MTVQRYRRRDRPGVKYVAFQVGGLMDSLPSWFQDLVAKGQAKDGEDCPSVKTITGVWRRCPQGTWVVYQQPVRAEAWQGLQNGYLWEMNAEAFNHLFYEVKP